jgi:hypothetical protein
MKESYGKDLASHPGPESCASDRKVAGGALTGDNAGPVLSCEIHATQTPTSLSEAEGEIMPGAIGEQGKSLAQLEIRSTHLNSLHGNREIPEVSAGVQRWPSVCQQSFGL